jgi:ABC-2 type transport system permease protein
MKNILNAMMAIAYRDIAKYVKNPIRILISLIFPMVFIFALGGSLNANIETPYNFMIFTFIGILAQTIFQTVAQGIISLVQDREQDLTQEFFVAPIPRYAIMLGKIVGEGFVGVLQGLAIIAIGFLIGVQYTLADFALLIPIIFLVTLMGGAFGIFIISFSDDSQNINRVFPLFIFPQFFLAGVFSPIKELPLYLLIPSRIVPLTYAVDLFRNIFYRNAPYKYLVTLYPIWMDISIIVGFTAVFLVYGTLAISARERNR